LGTRLSQIPLAVRALAERSEREEDRRACPQCEPARESPEAKPMADGRGKAGGLLGNRPALPLDWFLNGASQGELVLPVPSVVAGSLSKEHQRTPGRTIMDCRLRI